MGRHMRRPMGHRGRTRLSADIMSPTGQMSRKRPGGAGTWRNGRSRVDDLQEWPFGCFTLVPVDAAGSPRKVPGNSHCPRPLFRLYVACAEGDHASESALSERQRALLERLAAGEGPADSAPGDWRSALRDHGPRNARRGGGEARAEVTEASRFYLRHAQGQTHSRVGP